MVRVILIYSQHRTIIHEWTKIRCQKIGKSGWDFNKAFTHGDKNINDISKVTENTEQAINIYRK